MRLFSFCLIVISLLLTACGFRPLYGEAGAGDIAVQETLNLVAISNIPDREGQYLRNALIDRFYTGGYPQSPAWLLEVAPVAESITDLDITKSSDATRAQLRLSTAISLRDAQSGKIVLQRKLTAVTSYNILSSQFTTRVSEENTRRNGLDQLAAQIENQLALYFSRQ